MKKILGIAGMVLALAAGAQAEVIVDGTPANDISLSGAGAQQAYLASADTSDPKYTFTVTGGSVSATSTDGSAARIVHTDLVSGGGTVTISGGTLSATSSGVNKKGVQMFRSSDDQDVYTLSGGTFSGTTDGELHGFFTNRDGDINFSGGTWNFSQTDSSQGAIFESSSTANATINLSGGVFNNLDQFDTHIILDSGGTTTMNIDVLSLSDTGLTYIGDAIQDTTGTITGILADGNSFSFNFSAAAGRITTTVVPGPDPKGTVISIE